MNKWTYITNNDNTARYTLGKLGNSLLIFIGINPSTAKPDDLDRTVARVENFAVANEFDGWLMLNVYPQRATNPRDIHQECDIVLHKEHMAAVRYFLENHINFKVCAAWGTEIDRRPYLKDCLKDLVDAIGLDKEWLFLHELTKYEHPRHPLYLPAKAAFSEFDITSYINKL